MLVVTTLLFDTHGSYLLPPELSRELVVMTSPSASAPLTRGSMSHLDTPPRWRLVLVFTTVRAA